MHVYKKIADAVNVLTKEMDPQSGWIRLGIDGIVIGSLCEYAAQKSGRRPSFDMPAQISSNSDESDDTSIIAALMRGAALRKPIYGIDLKTKTGTLGKRLEEYVEDLSSSVPGIDFRYAVLFDQKGFANIRGSREVLTDEERLRWFEEPSQNPIKRVNGIWKYQTSNSAIEKLNHVKEIKALI